jgi:hypothetical protein
MGIFYENALTKGMYVGRGKHLDQLEAEVLALRETARPLRRRDEDISSGGQLRRVSPLTNGGCQRLSLRGILLLRQ